MYYYAFYNTFVIEIVSSDMIQLFVKKVDKCTISPKMVLSIQMIVEYAVECNGLPSPK